VAIQNNAYGSGSGMAQTIIKEVWSQREARLSAISDSMADTSAASDQAAAAAGAEGAGGGASERVPPVSPMFTPHSPTSHTRSAGVSADQLFDPLQEPGIDLAGEDADWTPLENEGGK
jgi:hypothetical protein